MRWFGEKPMILALGRKRAMERTLKPLEEMHRIAAAPISLAARWAAEVMALVIDASWLTLGCWFNAANQRGHAS